MKVFLFNHTIDITGANEIQFMDDHERSTLQQTEVGGLIAKAYELQADDRDEEASLIWVKVAEDIWPVLDSVIEGLKLDHKPTEDKVDRSYEKEYDLNDVLSDIDSGLVYARKHEERLEFNRRILDTFDTSKERFQYLGAKQGIAESLNALGRYEECDAFLDEWKAENRDEVYPDVVRLICLAARKKLDEAEALADRMMEVETFNAPGEDVIVLFELIIQIYREAGRMDKVAEAEARIKLG